MQNAHERFGTLEFIKLTKDTTTRVRVYIDRVELAKTKPGADREGTRTVLCDDDPMLMLYRVASRYGLPVVPEWAPWFMRELNHRKAIRPLTGLGCSPVVVSGNKPTFLKWIGKALREGLIHIPKENGSITWKLPRNFLTSSAPEVGMSVRAAT